MRPHDSYINGQFAPSSGERIEVIHPATEEVTSTVPETIVGECREAIAIAEPL